MDDEELLRDVDENGQDLTPWEVDFVSDLIDRLYSWVGEFRLTDTQRDKLEEIQAQRVF